MSEQLAKKWFYTFAYDTGTYLHEASAPITRKQLFAAIEETFGKKPTSAEPSPFGE